MNVDVAGAGIEWTVTSPAFPVIIAVNINLNELLVMLIVVAATSRSNC
ncbi:hypothetical protein [Secundilactobacillus silagei]|nr:hypothetical protein [Secundilactobacillus silagei]